MPQRSKSEQMNADPRNLKPVREAPNWTPDSWQRKPAVQQPTYPDASALAAALAQLHALPPLVTSLEVLNLQRRLADAAEGRKPEHVPVDCRLIGRRRRLASNCCRKPCPGQGEK